MMSIGELAMFLTNEVYLIKNDNVKPIHNKTQVDDADPDLETELEALIETAVPAKNEPVNYHPVLFVCDKELSGISLETFKNLVSKGLMLDENSYTLISQDQVAFSSPEEVNSAKLVLFGVQFSGFKTKYKLQKTDKQLVLVADSMDDISINIELKKQLWSQLQLMFPRPA